MASNSESPISIRMAAPMASRLDEVCKAMDRNRTWVIVEAVRRYLDENAEEIIAGAKGVSELDRGESEDLDAVLEDADAIIARAERARGAGTRA